MQQQQQQCRGCRQATETLYQCGRCHERRYCGRACQKKDWSAHKKTCQPPQSVGTPVCDADGIYIHVTGVPHYDEQEDQRFINLLLRYWPPSVMKFHSAMQFYEANERDGTAFMGNNEDISMARLMELTKKYVYNGGDGVEDDAVWRQRFADYDAAGAFITLCYFKWESTTECHCNAFCLVKADGVVSLMQPKINRSTFVFPV